MRKGAWLLAVLATSCLLPKFEVDSSLGPAAGGPGAGSSSAGSAGAGSGSGGKSVNGGGVSGSNTPGEGGDAGEVSIAAGGSGECAEDLIACGQACRDPKSDQYCGNCETRCSGPQSCSYGACKICPTGCVHFSTPKLSGGASVFFMSDLPQTINLDGATLTVKAFQTDPDYNSLRVVLIDLAGKISATNIETPVGSSLTETTLDLTESNVDLVHIKRVGFQIASLKPSTEGSEAWIDSLSVVGNAFGPYDFLASTTPLVFDGTLSNTVATMDWVGF